MKLVSGSAPGRSHGPLLMDLTISGIQAMVPVGYAVHPGTCHGTSISTIAIDCSQRPPLLRSARGVGRPDCLKLELHLGAQAVLVEHAPQLGVPLGEQDAMQL